jgi:hypothetical protein
MKRGGKHFEAAMARMAEDWVNDKTTGDKFSTCRRLVRGDAFEV